MSRFHLTLTISVTFPDLPCVHAVTLIHTAAPGSSLREQRDRKEAYFYPLLFLKLKTWQPLQTEMGLSWAAKGPMSPTCL